MNTQAKDNMELYNALRSVPAEAQKKIGGGPLAGFTDINPMWRIKMLTTTFGPCGLGWVIKDIQTWTSGAAGEEAVFVSLNLYVKYGSEWSEPIYGIGGSKVLVVDKNGPHLDDEAYKKAYTDAISIACKALGMAADVYFNKDIKTRDNRTKYDDAEEQPQRPAVYKPLKEETYWKIVRAHALGQKAKSGNSYRDDFKTKTNAGDAEMAKFDHDVEQVKIANNIQ